MNVFFILSMAFFAGGQAKAASAAKIVTFKNGTSLAQAQAAVEASGGRVIRELPLINALVVEANPREKFYGVSGTVHVDGDDKVWLNGLAVDSLAEQTGVRVSLVGPNWGNKIITPWGVRRVNAPAVWKVTQGRGVKVAVIDTGIDRSHFDLAPNIAGGWNVLTQTDNFQDDNGHGTFVAGIIAGAGITGSVNGVAPKVSLYGVKAIKANGTSDSSDIIAALDWAVNHHMDVVNLSLSIGNKYDWPLAQAVAAALRAGITIVASDGVDIGPVPYPAAYPGVIAVEACDAYGHVYAKSGSGPQITFIAPGVDIASTYPGGSATLSGTSFATPYVTGLAALAISVGISGPTAVKNALIAAAQPLPGIAADRQGAGFIDAAKLVHQNVGGTTP